MTGFSDAFPGQPMRHAANQSGHAIVGLGLWIVATSIWTGTGEIVAVTLGSAYFIVVEWAWQRLTLFWDSVEDSAHVVFGALIGISIEQSWGPWMFLTWAAILLFGVMMRLGRP